MSFYSEQMKNIDFRDVKSNDYTVASLFSGAGGSSLGYKLNGYDVVFANDFIREARETYEANFDIKVSDCDIRSLSASEITKVVEDLDILDGSPPCSGFSTSGAKSRNWGKRKRYATSREIVVVDDLFFEFARILKQVRPKVFVAENVTGLVKGESLGKFKNILKELKSCDYEVEVRQLNAMYFGVPQNRERIFFIGVRKDLVKKHNVHPVFPTPNPKLVTLAEALDELNPTINAEALDMPKQIIDLYNRTPVGKDDRHHFNFRRNSWKRPSYAVMAYGGDRHIKSIMHPDVCRKFYIDELKRICSFPDSFVVRGTYKEAYERMGRAVPPLLMYAISKEIKECILDVIKEREQNV